MSPMEPRKKRKNLDDIFSNVFKGADVQEAIASLQTRGTSAGSATDIADGLTVRPQTVQPSDGKQSDSQATDSLTVKPLVAKPSDHTQSESQVVSSLTVGLPTIKLSDSRQPDSQTAGSLTVEPLVARPPEKPRPIDIPIADGQVSDGQTTDSPTVKPFEGRAAKQAYRDKGIPVEVLQLPLNQACVLEFLIGNAPNPTNLTSITNATKVVTGTCRQAVDKLVSKGFLVKKTEKGANFQGFSYTLNKTLCNFFIECGGIAQEKYMCMLDDPYIRPSDTQQTDRLIAGDLAVGPSDSPPVHSSSLKPLKDLKPTTTSTQQTVRPSAITSQNFILTGSLGDYWMKEGLGEGQVKKWCADWEVSPEHMRLQLEWVRFDLEHNGKRALVKEEQAEGWLFGVLRNKAGKYSRPDNYKSEIELQAEALEQQLRKDREARERLYKLEAEQKFQLILAKPESAEYQALLASASSFAKEHGGFALEVELQALYEQTLRRS